MPQPSAAQLGFAIRSLRTARCELSIEALAAEAGIHWTSVARIEKGDQNVTWETLTSLATALDVDVVDLVRLAAERRDLEV